MADDDDLLQLSALQHLIFCERQCALIHLEGQWNENFLTALGRVMHEKKVDQPAQESRRDLKIEYAMLLRSLKLGLSGKADVVEFHRQADGSWVPFPVEHKLGKPKIDDSDRVQLCAQAMCLEEMLNIQVPRGALFYGRPRRREEVELGGALRLKTQQTAERLHALIQAGVTPPAVYEKKCDACSLFDLCLPKLASRSKSVQDYLKEIMSP